MKCNVGKLDRLIRGTLGFFLGIYALVMWSIVAGIVSIILVFTATTRWCIPYQLLGINTGCYLRENPYRSITSSLVEGIAVSTVLYLLVLLVYLVWRYINLALL